ncbi:hypothetical protein V6R21_12085 [Limibacter armeniacum]|uniref:hypothetical protein n=1 Tax=Limibacter armeniacum TaxID=466084 RepID=UPI002FE5603D
MLTTIASYAQKWHGEVEVSGNMSTYHGNFETDPKLGYRGSVKLFRELTPKLKLGAGLSWAELNAEGEVSFGFMQAEMDYNRREIGVPITVRLEPFKKPFFVELEAEAVYTQSMTIEGYDKNSGEPFPIEIEDGTVKEWIGKTSVGVGYQFYKFLAAKASVFSSVGSVYNAGGTNYWGGSVSLIWLVARN